MSRNNHLRQNLISNSLRLLAFIALALVARPCAQATVRFWTGGSAANNNWNTAANWSTGIAPVANDDLIFQGGAVVDVTSLNNTNNYPAGTVFNSITITGTNYVLNGNQILLTNSGVAISAQNVGGLNTINIPFQFSTVNQTFECTQTNAALDFNGTIDFNGRSFTNNATGTISHSGLLTGTGDLVKTGTGRVLLDGGVVNTYVGTTRVNAGTLELNDNGAPIDAMVPGNVVINSGGILLLTEGDQIVDTASITINGTGLFDLNGFNETIGSLTLSGGDVTTGTGTLTMNGNITNLATGSTISGKLSLGNATRTLQMSTSGLIISAVISGGPGAGINQTGGGQFTLSGANTYTGPTVISGFVILQNAAALGASGSATNGTFATNASSTILAQGVLVGDEFLTLGAGADFRSSGTAAWAGPITLNGNADINVFGGTFTNSGVISGPGGITKGQTGTLIFTGPGANTYTGTTVVNVATLELAKPNLVAVNGPLIIGDGAGGVNSDVVRELSNFQLAGDVTINGSGLLDLNGFTDTIGSLTFNGGNVDTGVGQLILGGNVIANASTNSISGVTGNLALGALVRSFDVGNGQWLYVNGVVSGSGGLTKNGLGLLDFYGTNTYSGLTTISNGVLVIREAAGLGTTATGTVLAGGQVDFIPSGSGLTFGDALTNVSAASSILLSSFSATLSNNVVLNADLDIDNFTSTLDISGVISGPAGIIKNNPGTLRYSGTSPNSYSGTTTVNGGVLELSKAAAILAVPGQLVIGDGTGPGTDTVILLANNQIADTAAVTMTNLSLFDVNDRTDSVGSVGGAGQIDIGVGILRVGNDNGSAIFGGSIVGTGSLFKLGLGSWTLNGNSTFSGHTTVSAGTLYVNGSQPQSAVTVNGTATLGGSGVIGELDVFGDLRPGSSPAILTTSNLLFHSSAANFFVDLTGPTAGSGYDQINVRGTNSLGSATLNLNVAFTSPVAVSNQFVIVNNDGAEGIAGTFNGLANNATISQGGYTFRINYNGTFDNDVTLTLIDLPGASAGATASAGNGDGMIAPNECNNLSVIITNKTGTPMTGVSATLAGISEGVAVTQPYSPYPNVSGNGKGTNLAPFQILCSSNFVCGSTVSLLLTVTTASHGSFTVPVSLTTGMPAVVPVRYDVSTSTNIPDLGTMESTNTVAGFVGPLTKVVVSLWITHVADSDLRLTLISPDGVSVDLSSDNGSGANFGSACSPDASRTTFDDAAAISITAGSPPYVGSFKPEGSLATLIGGTANGNWRLRVQDTFGGTLGTLRCWSLFLYGTDCGVGSGVCDLCPETVITSATGPASATQSGYVNYNGTPSTCGVPKVCPGTAGGGPFPSDNYRFRNGPSNACVTVTLELLPPYAQQMLITAYTNSYSPTNANKCLNYLADGGNVIGSANPTQSFAFSVESNAVFVVNVIASGTSPTVPYRLTVSGGSCRPDLNITGLPSNKAHLDWPTTAGGYLLESTNALVTGGSSLWRPVTNSPIVSGGRYHVTNDVPSTNVFYHLRKPVP